MGITDIAGTVITRIILTIQGLVLGFLGKGLSEVATLFGWFLKAQGNYLKDITIVQTSWTIFRDFANMFFILILVIIAFATIFDVQRYNWKGLMAKFLIAALLINFSLVISQFIINVSTTLSNVMLNQFSDITGNLAAGFGLNTLIDGTGIPPTPDVEKALINTIISFAGIIIVTAITLLSMLTALIFSIVRIPILWALMIISPLAWIAGVLPNTRKFFDWWQKVFLGWTFFMPVYLFALMMGVAILANRPDLTAASQMSLGQTALTRAGNVIGFTAQQLFFYVLTIIILVWGLGLSLKASFLSGTYVSQTFGAINGWVQRKTGVAGIKPLWERVKKEGLPEQWRAVGKLYTGARGSQKETAKQEQALSRFLGYTPDLKAQNQQVSEIDSEIKRLQDMERAGELVVDQNFVTQTLASDRHTTGGAAKRALLAERGMSNRADTIQSYREWFQRNPFWAQSFAERSAKGDHANIPKNDLILMAAAEAGGPFADFANPRATGTRKDLFNFIKKDKDALRSNEFNYNRFNTGLGLMGGSGTKEGSDFRKEIAGKRPDLVGEYDFNNPTGTNPPTSIENAIFRTIRAKSATDLAEVLEPAMRNNYFQNALTTLIATKQRDNPPAQNYVGGGALFKRQLVEALGGDARANIVRGIPVP